MYFESLRDRLFAEVPYPQALVSLMRQADSWRAFCELPLEIKQKFTYPEHQSLWDAGYKLRKRSQGREDKEYFHFLAKNKEYLTQYGLEAEAEKDPTLKRFFSFAKSLYGEAGALVLAIGKDLNEHLPGIAAKVVKSKDILTLRFLHYTPKQENDMSLADAHFDRSGFTLHLYESHSGLQLLDFALQWKDAPIREGATIVFTGYQLELFSRGELQKTWHRVARRKGAVANDSRTSIVLFVPLADTSTYPKEGRSQDEKPGYAKTIH